MRLHGIIGGRLSVSNSNQHAKPIGALLNMKRFVVIFLISSSANPQVTALSSIIRARFLPSWK